MAQQPQSQSLSQIAIAQQVGVNTNTTLIFGESGTAKSSNAGFEAERIFRETGKITRVVYADLGGAPYEHLIRAGVVHQVKINAMEAPLFALRRLSKGYWPTDPQAPNQLQLPEKTDWNKIGMYIWEGVTSCGDIIHRWLKLTGKRLSQDPNYTVEDTSGVEKEVFHGSNMSYFGFIQDTMYEIISSAAKIPVNRVIWTALEARGEDDTTKETLIGPSLAGKKAMAKLPSWVGDCLHFDLAPPEKDPKNPKPTDLLMKHRAYFVNHPDPKSGLPYKCKPRVPPRLLMKLLEKWPQGYVPLRLDGGLDEFLAMEEALVAQAAAMANPAANPAASVVKES